MLSTSELNRIIPKMNKHYTLEGNTKSVVNQEIIKEITKELLVRVKTLKKNTKLEILLAESK